MALVAPDRCHLHIDRLITLLPNVFTTQLHYVDQGTG
jgi:hypothetical protein